MKISQDTQEIINFLNSISDNNLRKSNDIATILEIGATYGESDVIDKIIFNGSFLWNLHKTMLKHQDTEQYQHLQIEFAKGLSEFSGLLNALIEISDETDKKRFDDTYLSMTQGAIKNIIDLAHDLSELKEVQNRIKNK